MTCIYYHYKFLEKFLLIILSFAGLFFFSGCASQKKTTVMETVITPQKEPEEPAEKEKVISEESQKCITCHQSRGITHGSIADWETSVHARKGVGCEDCHVGTVSEQAEEKATYLDYFIAGKESNCENPAVHRKVLAGICGKCHIQQYNEFVKSRHSASWERMLKASQSINLTGQTRLAKCGYCHEIQFKCGSCHTRHNFNTREAGTPDACKTCHTGPDHPHYEMYVSSKHGAGFTSTISGKEKELQDVKPLQFPVCTTCHMPKGTHDTSFGLAFGSIASKITSSGKKDVRVDEDEYKEKRKAMLSVCNTCHSTTFSKEKLKTADEIHRKVESVIHEAKGIITRLEKGGLIPASADKTSDIPFHTHTLILGDPQLYSSKSIIEQIYLKLINSGIIAWKGAYHMSPAYTHLYGWTELQMNLSDMKKEEKRILEEAELRRKMGIKLR